MRLIVAVVVHEQYIVVHVQYILISNHIAFVLKQNWPTCNPVWEGSLTSLCLGLQVPLSLWLWPRQHCRQARWDSYEDNMWRCDVWSTHHTVTGQSSQIEFQISRTVYRHVEWTGERESLTSSVSWPFKCVMTIKCRGCEWPAYTSTTTISEPVLWESH